MPNPRLLGFGLSIPCVTPVPESPMVKVLSDPFEVIVTLPLAEPAALGAKVTLNDVLCPAFSVSGNDRPLRLKPVPLALAAEIVRLVPPLFVSVSARLEVLPTCTLPKARLLGFGVSVPCVTPAPESGMFRFGLPPLDVIFTLPLAAPVALGENRTVNDVL